MRSFLASVPSFTSQDNKPARRRNRVTRLLNALTLGGPACHSLAYESTLLFLHLSDSGGPLKYPFGPRAILGVSVRTCPERITYRRDRKRRSPDFGGDGPQYHGLRARRRYGDIPEAKFQTDKIVEIVDDLQCTRKEEWLVTKAYIYI